MAQTCFVCDDKLGGDRVHLGTGIAPHSKLGLPAKISNLIGDDYVVVVMQSDFLCRRCSSILNHMDKLESELAVVKRTLCGHIKRKYSLNIGDQSDVKTVVTNGDVSPAKKIRNELLSPAKRPKLGNQTSSNQMAHSTPNKNHTPSRLHQEDVPKLKIYKCGFCSFQSKELNAVRVHMRLHIKNKPEEVKKPVTPITPVAATPPVQSSPIVRKKLFRCQVCSISFVDRKQCLAHIKNTHSTKVRKTEENGSLEDDTTNQEQITQPESQDFDEGEDNQITGQSTAMDSQQETQEEQATANERVSEGVGSEHRTDMDLEDIMAALHADSNTNNSEAIAMSI